MAKPDDRRDNVEKLQNMIHNTIENMEAAEETAANGNLSANQREQIEAKNERRAESIDSMREEIRDEANDMRQQ
ncbi:small acid-soluble spore protein Tlp [Aneurinibacillus terranovensis]|uniref:small acid-soluble spore protein Tlp n=1 Tax=Aneurinibacillus terranovensis TaxID=278991 RepID=UPI00041868AD|nr:small acid-soluble spore protein Tlp [Aneurinibacillus terranovensis]